MYITQAHSVTDKSHTVLHHPNPDHGWWTIQFVMQEMKKERKMLHMLICPLYVCACVHMCEYGGDEPWWCTYKNQAAMHPHTFLIPPAGSHPLPWRPDKTHNVLSSNWRRRAILTKWHANTHTYTRMKFLRTHRCQSILFQFPNWQANKC